LSFYEGVGVLKIEESVEVLKIEESESELLCTDSTALVSAQCTSPTFKVQESEKNRKDGTDMLS
jgi:hypothetical protein